MNCKGIAKPNVVMKIAYVEELPRVMIVCMRDINAVEELLAAPIFGGRCRRVHSLKQTKAPHLQQLST